MGSLYSAISGLQASSRWLDVVSNNVSNSNTVGFKGGRVNFQDMISQGLISASAADNTNNLGGINPSQLGLGVTVASIQNLFTQGALQTTGNATDIALQGAGFFTLKQGNVTLYTRAGNFTFDNQGNLVNPTGQQVQGWMATINRTGANGAILINRAINTAQPPSNIQVPQNLVLGPLQTSNQASPAIKDQGVIIKGNLDSNTPQNVTGAPPAAGWAADATTSFTVYDSLGVAHPISIYWQQTALTPGAAASWTGYAFDLLGGTVPSAANAMGNIAGVTFNSDGSLATNGGVAGANPTLTIPAGLLGGANNPDTFSVNLGTPNNGAVLGLRDGLTGDFGGGSIDPVTGIYKPVQTAYAAFVNGYSEGTLVGINVDQNGGVNATFSNNQTITVAKLAITNFSNPAGLQKAGGTDFVQSANSGFPQVGTAGANGFGTTTGGALEQSNVDLTVELTNMMVAQKMFESNARIITAADSILTTLVNLGK